MLPHQPAPYEPKHVEAIKRLIHGEATPEQQKIAIDWIINAACMTYDVTWFPGSDGDRNTSFASGRRFVGQQIIKLSALQTRNEEQK